MCVIKSRTAIKRLPPAHTSAKGGGILQAFLKKCPWSILAAGAAIQILTGVPSAWGVFQKAVCETYELAEADAAMIFSFVICFFGIGCILGGLLQDKAGPRAAGLSGAVLLGGGFCMAGWLVPAGIPWAFYLAFSVPVGLGCAFLYPSVMSCAQKWYAEKKGLATGVIGGAVGLSGAVLTWLGRFLIARAGIRGAFLWLGALMFAVCAAACVLLENPQGKAAAAAAQGAAQNYTVGQMLKTKQYWLLFFVVALATLPTTMQLSAAGRLLMPWLSDKIGRRYTDMLLFAALAGLSVWFAFAQGWLVIAVYSLLTFCYSGEAAVIPAAVTDLFGQKNAGVNYGFAALGMSLGSIGFPLAARFLGLEAGRHWLAVGAAAAGLVCLLFLKPTQGKRL